MATFGETSWGEDSSSNKKFSNNKDTFLRLDDGDNEIRIITQPFQYLSHKYKKEGDKGYGQKVGCSKTENTGCVLCDIVGEDGKPSRPQKRWFIGVIERKKGTAKVLDISYAVKQQIDALTQNTKYFGNPTEYDINLKVNRNGGATGYYMVQGLPKTPMSASDMALRDAFDVEDLRRRCVPLTPEQVEKRIERIDSGVGWGEKPTQAASPAPAKASAKPAAKKAPALPPVEELPSDDSEFPEVL